MDELQPDGSVLRRAKGQFAMPIPAEWTEDLGEWVEQRYMRQLRQFTKGGFHHIDFVVRAEPTADGFAADVGAHGALTPEAEATRAAEAVCSEMSACVSAPRSASRHSMTTRAPRLANSVALTSPMPELAPVTMKT